jgi:hypothetical protein
MNKQIQRDLKPSSLDRKLSQKYVINDYRRCWKRIKNETGWHGSEVVDTWHPFVKPPEGEN